MTAKRRPDVIVFKLGDEGAFRRALDHIDTTLLGRKIREKNRAAARRPRSRGEGVPALVEAVAAYRQKHPLSSRRAIAVHLVTRDGPERYGLKADDPEKAIAALTKRIARLGRK